MTYADKLKDPRWFDFREDYIRRHKRYDEPPACTSCGSEECLQLHHRYYERGKEPWQYPDNALILLCDGCHGLIHAAEIKARKWIIGLPSHAVHELDSLLDELIEASEKEVAKIALAWAKNAARDCNQSHRHGSDSDQLAGACERILSRL